MRSNRAEIQRLVRLSYYVRNRCCCLAKIGRTEMWRSMTTGQRSCPAGRITGTLKQAVSGKACAGCMKEFCRITAASAGLMSKLSMAGYKVAGRSQKQPRRRPFGNGRSADSVAYGKAPRTVLSDRAIHHGIFGFAGRVVARECPIGIWHSRGNVWIGWNWWGC